MTRKFWGLLFLISAIMCSANAATLELVDGDGRKIIDLTNGIPVKKQVSNKEGKSCKSLAIKGKLSNKKDCEALVTFLTYCINLEELDISEFVDEGYYMAGYPTLKKDFSIPKGLPVKRLITKAEDNGRKVDTEQLLVNTILAGLAKCPSYLPYIHSLPNIEEYVLKEAFTPFNKIIEGVPDSLTIYDKNTPHNKDLSPILVISKGCIVYKKVEITNPLEYNILRDGFTSNLSDLDEIDLSKVVYVGYSMFKGSKIKELHIPKSLVYIGQSAFSECKQLERITFDDVSNILLMISDGAFRETNLKEIEFKRPVMMKKGVFAWNKNLTNIVFDYWANIGDECFKESELETVRFNGEVANIGRHTFKQVGQMTFAKVPKKVEREIFDIRKNDCYIYIPEGTSNKFSELGFNMRNVSENISASKLKSYSIELKQPNTLLSFIQPSELEFVDSLTIRGFLYDTELKIITGKCKNLRYLNIANALTTKSPETLRDEETDRAAWRSLVATMGIAADNNYRDFRTSSNDYLIQKMFIALCSENAKVKKAEDICVIPKGLLAGMVKLETVILPKRLSVIGAGVLSYCPNLKDIKLPPFLKEINTGAFSHCENLQEIQFPTSVVSIGGYGKEVSFLGTGIRKIDLSKCHFKSNYIDGSWSYHFKETPALKELYLPQGVEYVELRYMGACTIYIPSSVNHFNIEGGSEFHFYSRTAPSGKKITNSTIYIPKGCTTSYFAKYGDSNQYIEE